MTSLQDQSAVPARLGGAETTAGSAAALTRWPTMYLVEDNSARATRRPVEGLARTRTQTDVVIRVHRITRAGIWTVAEARYRPGRSKKHSAGGKAGLALGLLDAVTPGKKSVIVAGPEYGGTRGFLEGLGERDLDAVVEIRPSTRVSIGATQEHASSPVRDLLADAKWTRHTARFAGSAEPVEYSIAVLGEGRVRSEQGILFAGQKGGINGIHPGTIVAIAVAGSPWPDELLQSVGWTRWIRPLVRRIEKPSALNGLATKRAHSNGSPLRANITLARRHDAARDSPGEGASHRPALTHQLASLSRPLNVVELFAGGGGMGLGFMLAGRRSPGYRLVVSGEVHPIFVRTLINNHALLQAVRGSSGDSLVPARVVPLDLRLGKATRDVLNQAGEAGGADIVIGGPPCQGFSNANRNSWHTANPHNSLIDVFLGYVKAMGPKVFLLENVQGLHWTTRRARGGQRSMLEHIQEQASALGYEVFIKLLDAVWYGVPQYRSRFFVLGLDRALGYTRGDFAEWGPFPRPTHGPGTARPYVTVSEAIADLPLIGNGHSAGETAYQPRPARDSNRFLRSMRRHAARSTITDHVTSRHADYVIERYRQIPPGGNWEDIQDQLTNYADVRRTHSNIYRRLTWDEPSITIGHYRKSMLVHPSHHRGLSLREACRLQSFPDWFRFAGSAADGDGGLVHKQQQLANAVCPLLTQAIADFILRL